MQQEHLTAVQILPFPLHTRCLWCLKEHRGWRLEKVYGNRDTTSSLEEVPCAELYLESNLSGEIKKLFFSWSSLANSPIQLWWGDLFQVRPSSLLPPKGKSHSLLAPAWLTIPGNKAEAHGVSSRVNKAKKIACAHKMEINFFKHLPHATAGVVAQGCWLQTDI